LSSHFGDYGSPNIVSQKGKDAPRSQYLGQIVQIAQDLIVGEIRVGFEYLHWNILLPNYGSQFSLSISRGGENFQPA
jgi:hypothetical protein